MQFRAGDRINHYTLLEALGEGGQGSVWRVFDPRDGGVGPLMDLVPGRSLADTIEARGLDRGQSLALLTHVVDALAYVHGENLVHRDLKPANLMLTEQFWEGPTRPGVVKLVDFGIAAGAGNTQLTRPGTVIGTLPYLAPELVDPATWGKSEGPPRDVFALGVLAYQLLMHKHPTGLGFDAAIIDFARAYKAAEAGRIAWPPPGIEGSWGVAVAACLALRPADRPANGAAVIELLRTGVVSSRASRPVQPGLTSVYGAPRVEAPTEIARPPVSVRTAPMAFAPPSSVKTIEQAPRLDALLSTAPKPPSKIVWAALLLVGGGIGGAAIFALLHGASPEVPPIPLPTTTVPVSTAPVAPPPASIAPCRRPGLRFDERDTRFGCPLCRGEPRELRKLAKGEWTMRFHGVTPAIPMVPDLTRKICAQVSGAQTVCLPYTSLPGTPGGAGRLPITTADINGDLIYFSIRGKAGIEAKGFAHRKPGPTGFLESALCSGFLLYLDDPAVTISVFLDER